MTPARQALIEALAKQVNEWNELLDRKLHAFAIRGGVEARDEARALVGAIDRAQTITKFLQEGVL